MSDVIYSHHMGDKFIRVGLSECNSYVNTSAIASVHPSFHPDYTNHTQINMLSGISYYTLDSLDDILKRIVELT